MQLYVLMRCLGNGMEVLTRGLLSVVNEKDCLTVPKVQYL